MNFINKKYVIRFIFSIIFFAIFLVCIILFSLMYWSRYTIRVLNYTENPVVIHEINVDDRNLFLGNKILPLNTESNKQSELMYLDFISHDPGFLEISIGSVDSINTKKYSCEFFDQQKSGCLFSVVLLDANTINCTCDSYAAEF